MRVIHHPSGPALLEHAGAFLERSEAENGLILGICTAWAEVEGALWISVDDEFGPVFVAVRTPPFDLVVSLGPRAAIEAIAADLAARSVTLPGVNGRAEASQTFAGLWNAARGGRSETTMRQGLYRLRKVIPPAKAAPGRLRVASEADLRFITDWMGQFAVDAKLPPVQLDSFTRRAPSLVAEASVFLWDDAGTPACMACLLGRTKHGIRIGMVFTPNELRGRGYASSFMAAVSAHALASGRNFCVLYTDLANPTSNGIYQRVGYEQLCETEMIAFVP